MKTATTMRTELVDEENRCIAVVIANDARGSRVSCRQAASNLHEVGACDVHGAVSVHIVSDESPWRAGERYCVRVVSSVRSVSASRDGARIFTDCREASAMHTN